MKRLMIKNFAPLKEIDIELRDINLFIGENGSGKSILAKIITIILDLDNLNEKDILKKFRDFNIDFLTKETVIKLYEKENIIFELKNKKEIKIDINKRMNNSISSRYIPAERNLISLFNKSLSSLIVNEIPLPKFLLHFTSEFEKAGNEMKELEFLNVKYVNGDGLDRHKICFDDENYLPLEFSSSGIQSALPLYLTIKYFAQKHRNIIIEEPELNLFPKAQYETVKYIIKQIREENNLFMMTHSPYILSALNNLIFAYKVGQLGEEAKKEVKELFDEKQWINPNDFSAYYLENGKATNIVSKRGLISENKIDDISEDIAGEFDELLDIYREFRND